MDAMTADLCKHGRGKVGYTRILVEVNAKKHKHGKCILGKDNGMDEERTNKKRPIMQVSVIVWKAKGKGVEAIRGKNKYSVLERQEEDAGDTFSDKEIMDQFLVEKRQPNMNDTVSNMVYSDRGCRILMGYDSSVVNVTIIHMSKQSVFCLIESINGRFKMFCSFVYASNAGRERRTLWKDLEIQKRFTNGYLWILIGDFNVTLKIEENLIDEEKLLFQQARIKWLRASDKNNAYFHSVIRSKRNLNRIECICDDQETRYTSDDIPPMFVHYFQQFLGMTNNTIPISKFCNLFTKTLSYEDTKRMVTGVTKKEIKEAMFDIGDNKALGLDGYTFTFLKKAWDVISDDVCLAINEFFST
ncbi:RNA-directed DNA polymerase, eukaryota, reverse transcriptase zinc-binding domain protein [Tanacetum coccineum]